jgi:hypothetical protein
MVSIKASVATVGEAVSDFSYRSPLWPSVRYSSAFELTTPLLFDEVDGPVGHSFFVLV